MDERVREGVRRQKIVSEMRPEAPAGKCFAFTGKKVAGCSSLGFS